MMPYSEIRIGDVYQPYGRGRQEWMVYEKNDEEKMVQIVALEDTTKSNPRLVWKKNTDKIFTNRAQKRWNEKD